MMDAIELDVHLSCIVGILPRERIEPQPLEISARLELDLEGVGRSGDLERGVDYASIDAQFRFLAVEGRFRLLESLALALLRAALTGPVERASVRIAKPAVLRAAVPAIAVARSRGWAVGDRWIDVPEVEVYRDVALPGVALTADAVFSLDAGAVPCPFTPDRPTSVLVVRRR
ncbi:MAG: dihydroneopterin aldolase [Myxococcota bacterium]